MRVRAGARVTTDNERAHNQKTEREKEAGGAKRVKKTKPSRKKNTAEGVGGSGRQNVASATAGERKATARGAKTGL